MTTAVDTPARLAGSSRRDRSIVLASFVVGTVISVWRVWDRLAPAGLYAEDGLIFYLQADLIGPGAIFRPYAGYLHLISRLGAAVIAPFGLPAAPLGYALISTILTIAGFSLVLSSRLDRFIPSAWGRGLAFLVLCLVPQFTESATGLAYLIFIGGVPLVLIGLSRTPNRPWAKIAEAVAVAVLGLSGPFIVFYLPLFVYRWFRDRSRANIGLLIVAAATALVQGVVFLTNTRVATGNFGFDQVPRAYLQRIVGELLVPPESALTAFAEHTALRLLTVVFLLIVVAIALVEVRWDAVVVLGVTGLSFAWAIRTYGAALFDPRNGDRHMLVPAATLLITMVAAFAHAVLRAQQSDSRLRWFHGTLAVVSGLALVATIGGIRAGAVIPPREHVPTHDELVTYQACVDEGRKDCAPVLIAPGAYSIDVNHPWDPSPY